MCADLTDVRRSSETDLELSLTAQHGTLSLASISGLAFTSGANGDAAFTIQGSLTEVN